MKYLTKWLPTAVVAAFALHGATVLKPARAAGMSRPAAQDEQRDYLSEDEAAKIRDDQTAAGRIKLYLSFAQDRLDKFEYELNRPEHEAQYDDILNNLMNGYVGCVDDAADQIDVAQEKQEDVRGAVKEMKDKDTAFLAKLQKFDQASGPDFDAYRYTLEDAIEGTKEAINDATDAEKTLLPGPVRRKQ
ncbi:MAG TPA: hypothetical protein VMB47_14435 [Candidatus Aquilonibacter sp.]|nr:hypothetical protein [Candidatus Aquilonibacter sp.]